MRSAFSPTGSEAQRVTVCTWSMWPASHAWPGPTTNALCSSHTQVISRTHSFIVLSQFFESLYSFFWDQSSLHCAHSCFCEQTPHYWDLLDVGRSHTCAVRHAAVKPKASVMLAFPKVWEGCHLPPLLFDVLEVLANKLDKNKIQNVIYRLPW